jgi:hypothetical protein
VSFLHERISFILFKFAKKIIYVILPNASDSFYLILALKKTNASDIYDTFDLKERKRKEIKLWLSMNEFGLTLVEVHLLVQ